MSSYSLLVVTTGLALFSMFFGSGNLVYPLAVGAAAGSQAFFGALGLILTAVCVPLAGCLGILFYEGSPRCFFSFLGDRGFRLLAFICLSLMGPFGVLARCLTVAHGTFSGTGVEISATLFSAVSCLLLWLAAFYRQAILELLGKWLTPLLLATLTAIIACGLWQSYDNASYFPASAWTAFGSGAHQGYQMMDLLAAFFFSGFVIAELKAKLPQKEAQDAILPLFIKASCLAGALLALIYVALIYLGFHYATLLSSVPPQSMLATIATHTIGPFGGTLACVTFILACFTTALVLTVLFADFLRTELLGDKIPNWLALLITVSIAFFISTLEFSGIASFLGPLMEAIYPFMIAVTAYNIARYVWQTRQMVKVGN